MVYVTAEERRKAIVAAARRVCERDGVASMTMRRVAEEAGIPLGTMQHVFPTRGGLLRAVIDDVDAEIDAALRTGLVGAPGLAATLRVGITTFWEQMVASQVGLQIIQYELTLATLRIPSLYGIAAWQYRRYAELASQWCREAAEEAGETIAVSFDTLARVLVAAVDGLILQYVVDPDDERAAEDLHVVINFLTALASPRRTKPRASERTEQDRSADLPS